MSNKHDAQKELAQALQQHDQVSKQLDRIFWPFLPFFAFLLSTIFANANNWSWIGTFIMLSTAFIAVGIKKYSLTLTLIAVIIYCFIDIYFSYSGHISIAAIKRQLCISVFFVALVGLGRPFLEGLKKRSV